ncbi:MAG: penicillin-binding protein 1A, partial [Acetobacteraceae bacterium]|nr:penicillin-binding protein 1A [Acetobacteraceae bacterium]
MSGPLRAGERLSPPVPPVTPPADDPGKPLRPARSSLRWIGRILGALAGLAFVVFVVGAVGLYGAYHHFASDLPDVDGLRSYQPKVMSRIYAGDARVLSELATERRIFVPYNAIPEIVKQAFVSAEDQNYWSHRGVDPLAIVRAAFTDLSQMRQGRRPVGASTITQQVAKNMLLDSQLSLSRKIKEAILAMRIEETLSKERILELYLNEIYLGLQSYGVAAAAQTYFNKPLDDLNIQDAAFLAALPKAPNNYNPFRFPEAAKARRDWVIDRMMENRVITPAQAAEAKAQPIIPGQFHRPEPIPGADWFAEEVRRRLIDRFGAEDTTEGGLMVRTSLDPRLQTAAEKSLRNGLVAYDRRFGGWRGPVGHLDGGPALRTNWTAPLATVARPPGILPAWRLAVVTEASDRDAKVGWVERDPASGTTEPRTGQIVLSDLAWARPVHEGRPGAVPHRMGDVLRVGDVVMVEPESAAVAGSAPPSKVAAAARTARVELRQIPQVQGALVSLDPGTGRVLAMVGGWSFEMSQFNRATQAMRQPGSSFKPFVYLTALEQGVSPSQRFLDAPFVLDQGAAGQWRPNNYGGTFSGPVPLRIALEKSLNLVTVRVAQKVGMEAVAQTAIAFHVVDNMPRVLPASLGAVDTTVLRIAGAYASLAEGGREVTPSLIDSVQDRDGHVVMRNQSLACEACDDTEPPTLEDTRTQIADPPSVFQLVTMMQGVVQRGTGSEAGKGMGRPIAGKTGTSQDFNDAWFVGFTPDLVTAVWIGFDNPASLGDKETGGAVAAPIWRNYMTVALKDHPVLSFPQPPGVSMARWDSGSGMVTDAFKPDQTPGASTPV